MALKLDAEGAYYFEGGTGTHLGPAQGRLVDATGAGDAFAGAFLAARLRGVAPLESAVLANRVSAWVIERVGARPALDRAIGPVLADLDAAVRAAGWGEAGVAGASA